MSEENFHEKTLHTASLRDLEQLQSRQARNGRLIFEVLEFLRSSIFGVVQQQLTISNCFNLPQVHRGFQQIYAGWTDVKTTGGLSHFDFWAPTKIAYESRPGSRESFIISGAIFLEHEGRRRVIILDSKSSNFYSDDSSDGFHVVLLAEKSDEAELEAEQFRLRDFVITSRHYLQGQVISNRGRFLKVPEVAWSELALPQEVIETVRRNTIGFLRDGALRSGRKFPKSRGLILHGPPGCGKTMLGKALATEATKQGSPAATFIFASPGDLNKHGIESLFTLARRLNPTIAFLEDVDCMARNRLHGYSGMLGDLLVNLDGLVENDQIVFVATTNDLEQLDPAIRDRPRRFDLVIEITRPKPPERAKLLRARLPESLEGSAIEQLAEATEGLSGAQVAEFALRLADAAEVDQLDLVVLARNPVQFMGLAERILEQLAPPAPPRIRGFAC